MRRGKFEIEKDKKGEFRFRLKSSNGKIIAVSEGYKTKRGCLNGIYSVMNTTSAGCSVKNGNHPEYVIYGK
jgi:uncharacterized protein YegP (UPF0339 family)